MMTTQRHFLAVLLLIAVNGKCARGADFTIVLLPDTQIYVESYPEQFNAQTRWIAENRDDWNISFVSQVGDVVQNNADGPDRNLVEWQRADRAMATLDEIVDLPYSTTVGSHDYDQKNINLGPANRYVEFFGADRFAGRPWYGGSSPNSLNQYQYFEGDGRRFLHLGLEWEPSDSVLQWAQSVIDANPGLPTVVSTHMSLEPTGRRQLSRQSASGNTGDQMFKKLVAPNSQVFMVLNGHRLWEAHALSTNNFGEPVIEILADYQFRSNGGDGWMQLIQFRPELSRIDVETFSPTRNNGLGQFEIDANSRFSFALDFDQRFGGPSIPEPSGVVLLVFGLSCLDGRCFRRRTR